MIISPAGRPPSGPPATFAIPAGTVIAGWPVTSIGAVLAIMPPEPARYSSRLAPAGGMGLATSGSVGMTSTSARRSASS